MGQKKAIPQTAPAPGLLLMNAVAVSSTNTYTSSTFNANNVDNIGLQITFGGTGTMVGTLSVECSIDNVTFQPLTFSPSLTQPSGSPLSYLISLNQVPFPYLKLSYTNSSGSGTLTAYLSAKDVN